MLWEHTHFACGQTEPSPLADLNARAHMRVSMVARDLCPAALHKAFSVARARWYDSHYLVESISECLPPKELEALFSRPNNERTSWIGHSDRERHVLLNMERQLKRTPMTPRQLMRLALDMDIEWINSASPSDLGRRIQDPKKTHSHRTREIYSAEARAQHELLETLLDRAEQVKYFAGDFFTETIGYLSFEIERCFDYYRKPCRLAINGLDLDLNQKAFRALALERGRELFKSRVYFGDELIDLQRTFINTHRFAASIEHLVRAPMNDSENRIQALEQYLTLVGDLVQSPIHRIQTPQGASRIEYEFQPNQTQTQMHLLAFEGRERRRIIEAHAKEQMVRRGNQRLSSVQGSV